MSLSTDCERFTQSINQPSCVETEQERWERILKEQGLGMGRGNSSWLSYGCEYRDTDKPRVASKRADRRGGARPGAGRPRRLTKEQWLQQYRAKTSQQINSASLERPYDTK